MEDAKKHETLDEIKATAADPTEDNYIVIDGPADTSSVSSSEDEDESGGVEVQVVTETTVTEQDVEMEDAAAEDLPKQKKDKKAKKKSKKSKSDMVDEEAAEEKLARKESKANKKRKRNSEAGPAEAVEEVAEAAEDVDAAKEKKRKKKKTKKAEEEYVSEPLSTSTGGVTADGVEQWNVTALEGGDARRRKFLRLLGAKKANGASVDAQTGSVPASAPTRDIASIQNNLERQFETGMRRKDETGGRKRGLGA